MRASALRAAFFRLLTWSVGRGSFSALALTRNSCISAAARSLPLGLLRELSEKADAARTAMHGKMDAAKGRVAHAAMLCGSLSPYSVLARGYSIARKAGSVLKSSADASEGDRVEVQLAAGRLGCRVETIITEEEL